MPILLAKLGPDPGLRLPLPLLGVLDRRPFPNISCASASFFLRKRSSRISSVQQMRFATMLLTCLYDVVERNRFLVSGHTFSSLSERGIGKKLIGVKQRIMRYGVQLLEVERAPSL